MWPIYDCISVLAVSRASAAALSNVLRTTTLSYGKMRFSGTCPAETPEPIIMKFCIITSARDYAMCQKMVGIGWLGTAPQIGEIQPKKTYLTIFYLTLPLFSCMPLKPKRLNQFARTMARLERRGLL